VERFPANGAQLVLAMSGGGEPHASAVAHANRPHRLLVTGVLANPFMARRRLLRGQEAPHGRTSSPSRPTSATRLQTARDPTLSPAEMFAVLLIPAQPVVQTFLNSLLTLL
jgi:hypothetical protein